MIGVGIGQIIAAILLILSGWFLMSGEPQPIIGAVCVGVGLYFLYGSIRYEPPAGV